MGHAVEVHEAGPLPGGMMHFGIPAYRLSGAEQAQRDPAPAHVGRSALGRCGRFAGSDHGSRKFGRVLKYILAGADVVMTTSALLRHGLEYVASLLAGVTS